MSIVNVNLSWIVSVNVIMKAGVKVKVKVIAFGLLWLIVRLALKL
jgi:hypothetical protein